jgi:hypothetical protein
MYAWSGGGDVGVCSCVVPLGCRRRGTEVCLKSPFRDKEFLPGGIHYNLNPREVFRGPYRLNLGVGASLSHRYL